MPNKPRVKRKLNMPKVTNMRNMPPVQHKIVRMANWLCTRMVKRVARNKRLRLNLLELVPELELVLVLLQVLGQLRPKPRK